ncbi:hypothetical protein WJX77_000584 [Trebouxia sp. C0004]
MHRAVQTGYEIGSRAVTKLGKRKRVSFAEEPDVVKYEPVADQEAGTQQPEHGSHTFALNSDLQDPPAIVVEFKEEASDRATLQYDNMQGIEDTSILEDLAEAEEVYDKPDQAFNEAGVAFEPFHLKKEREEGYFDADGNYIQYKLDEVKDAWLDSLAEGDFLACLPGGDKTTAPQPPSREYGSAASISTRTGRTVPVENRDAFDSSQSTLACLLQHWDYNIHSTKREQIAAETDAGEAAQLQAVMGVLTTACTSNSITDPSQTDAIRPTSSALHLTPAALEPVHLVAIKAMPNSEERGMQSTIGLGDSDGMAVDAPSVAELGRLRCCCKQLAEAAAAEQAVRLTLMKTFFGGPERSSNASYSSYTAAAGRFRRHRFLLQSLISVIMTGRGGQQLLPFLKHQPVAQMWSNAQDTGSGFLYDEPSGTWYNAGL